RIRNTRWPDEIPRIDWKQGTSLAYLRPLLAYWADGFDWRAREAELNAFPQFRGEVDGVQIHFVHLRSSRPIGIPLILTHGWPSSFIELLPLAPYLSERFDLVIPSLPGYGFSERPLRTGVTYRYVARLWHRLMDGLGYARYGAVGGDFGAGVATYMALDTPGRMLGIYLYTPEMAPSLGPGSPPLSDAEQTYLAVSERWSAVERGYSAIQSTKPQT